MGDDKHLGNFLAMQDKFRQELDKIDLEFEFPEKESKGDLRHVFNCKQLNFRIDPSLDGEVICTLAKGTIVEVLDNDDEWASISVNGKQGYVKTQYLSFIDCE